MLDPHGFCSARLKRLDERLCEKYLATGRLPGFVLQVWRGGESVHTAVAGRMDLERDRPMREDAIFRIYSMTKPITAVAVMLLVEEGLISLNDDVHLHLPSWRGLGVCASGKRARSSGESPSGFSTRPPDRPMKVIDLMTHTSGLTHGMMMRSDVDAAYRALRLVEFDRAGGLTSMAEDLAVLPLEFSPGERWNYSVSLDVLGHLVEAVSGLSFGAFLRERIFGPLGMADTDFHCPEAKRDRFACCYAMDAAGGLVLQDDGLSSPRFGQPPALESGGGGLVSTTRDYMILCRLLLNGGALDDVRILSPKTVELFSLNHLPDGRTFTEMALPGAFANGYGGLGFSLGCAVTVDVAATRMPGTPGEFFWGGMAGTTFWVDPREDLAVVLMTQLMGAEVRMPLRRDLHTLVYAAMSRSWT